MYCRNCGQQIDPNAWACPKCGCRPLQGSAFCSKCGEQTKTAQVLCTACGHTLTRASYSNQKLVAGLLGIYRAGYVRHP